MAKAETYTIPHIGLKKEVHTFEYHLTKEFFQKHENELLGDADVYVKVIFDKRNTPYIIDFDISGKFTTDCDKCAAQIPQALTGDFRIYVKFDTEADVQQDENLEIVFISPDEPEIDLETYLYDFVNLSVPYARMCEDPGNTPYCDMEVIALLDKLQQPEETEQPTDPRWEGLNKLKDLN